MIKVKYVEPRENYVLFIKLSNGKKGFFDIKSYIEKGIFSELKDINYFRTVRTGFGGVIWPHEQDFSADTIEHELQVRQIGSSVTLARS